MIMIIQLGGQSFIQMRIHGWKRIHGFTTHRNMDMEPPSNNKMLYVHTRNSAALDVTATGCCPCTIVFVSVLPSIVIVFGGLPWWQGRGCRMMAMSSIAHHASPRRRGGLHRGTTGTAIATATTGNGTGGRRNGCKSRGCTAGDTIGMRIVTNKVEQITNLVGRHQIRLWLRCCCGRWHQGHLSSTSTTLYHAHGRILFWFLRISSSSKGWWIRVIHTHDGTTTT